MTHRPETTCHSHRPPHLRAAACDHGDAAFFVVALARAAAAAIHRFRYLRLRFRRERLTAVGSLSRYGSTSGVTRTGVVTFQSYGAPMS